MFEKLAARAERRARARADAAAERLARTIAAAAPRGIGVERSEGGVRLSGRGLRRRFALEPALRWLIAGIVK